MSHRSIVFIAFLACLGVLAAGYLHFGLEMGGDAARYVGTGKRLLQSLATTPVSDTEPGLKTSFYLIPNLLLGGGTLAFGERFAPLSVGLNALAFSVFVLLLFQLWTHYAAPRVPLIFLPLGLYVPLGLPADVTKHVYSALSSDVLALSIIGVFWVCLSRAIVSRSSAHWWAAWALALVSVITRPTGLVVVAFIAIAATYVWVMRRAPAGVGRGLANAALLLLPALAALLLWPYLVYLHGRGASWMHELTSVLPGWIMHTYHRGVVVNRLVETYLPAPVSYWDYLSISLHRLAYYVTPFRPGYSTAHTVLNAAYVVFMLWASTAGWTGLRRGGTGSAALAVLLLAFSGYFALFHSMTLVDDWRYQLPLWPSLWILAGFGVLVRLRCAPSFGR